MVRIKKWNYILLIFCFTLLVRESYSNSFELKWFNYSKHCLIKIDLKTQKVYQENIPIHRFDEIGVLETSHPEITMLDCNYFDVKEFKIKNRPIISIKGTSLVYELVQQKDKFRLNRLDQSNFKGYNFFAYQFVRKDTLFSIGGYGFWTYNNVLTFFDEKNKGWEIYKYNNDAPNAVMYDICGYDTSNDVIWTLNFLEPKQLNDGKVEQYLFLFDFKSKLWRKKGIINKSIFTQYNVSLNRAQWTQKGFLFNVNEGSFLIHPNSNSVLVYDQNKGRNFLSPSELIEDNDSIYVYHPLELNPFEKFQSHRFGKVQFIDFFKPIDEKFYKVEMHAAKFYWFIILIIVLIIFIGLKFKKDKNKSSSIFSHQELDFLKMLLQRETGLSTDELNAFLDIDKKNVDIQKNQRNNFIKNINSKYQIKFNLSDSLVERKSSSVDKRFIIYVINEKQKFTLKSIL